MNHTPKIIAVTGGNRGIGLEICRQLAALGHQVILCSRDMEKGKLSAQGLKGNVEVRQLDVANEDSIRDFAADLPKDHAQLDVLINNAGVISTNKGTLTATMAEIREVFEPNFFGPWLLSQCCLPLLRKGKDARIVNISSQMGGWDALTDGYAAYRLSKVSLNAMTLLMANELQSEGVKVNAMCPGWVKTDMGGRNAERSVSVGADTAVWLATAENIPTGKLLSDRKVRPW